MTAPIKGPSWGLRVCTESPACLHVAEVFLNVRLKQILCCSREDDINFLQKQCYTFAGWKVLRCCYVQVGDDFYSFFLTCGISGMVAEILLCFLFTFFPLSFHPDRDLSLALVSGYLDQLSKPQALNPFCSTVLPIASRGSVPLEHSRKASRLINRTGWSQGPLFLSS